MNIFTFLLCLCIIAAILRRGSNYVSSWLIFDAVMYKPGEYSIFFLPEARSSEVVAKVLCISLPDGKFGIKADFYSFSYIVVDFLKQTLYNDES